MNWRACTPLLAAALFAALPAFADSVDLGSHGKLEITVPKGWTLFSQKTEDAGYAVTLTPPGDANAKGLITVAYLAEPESVSKEKVDQQVRGLGEQFVDQSVEKKEVLRDFGVAGGYGAYCVFTDASLVGQPAKRDSFKVLGVGVVRFGQDVLLAVSLLADDENGAEFKAMLGAVSAMKFSAPK